MDRRSFLILVAAGTGCSPEPGSPPAPAAVWIRQQADGSLLVNGASADVTTIDAVVLEQAVALNPTLTPEQVRATVQVYVQGHPDAPLSAYQDLVHAVRRVRFEHVGIVGEDQA